MFVHNTNPNTFNFNDSCYARKVLPIQGQQRHNLAIVYGNMQVMLSLGEGVFQCLLSSGAPVQITLNKTPGAVGFLAHDVNVRLPAELGIDCDSKIFGN